jgi:hypothetical protein
MLSLSLKLILGTWWICLLGSLLLDVSGFTKSRLGQMDEWNDTKLDLLQRASLRSMVLTMQRLLLLLLVLPLFDLYL